MRQPGLAAKEQVFDQWFASTLDASLGAFPLVIGRFVELAIERVLVMHRLPRGKVGARDQIVSVSLMLQYHQSDNVAVRRQVRRDIDNLAQVGNVRARFNVKNGFSMT